MLEKGVCWCLMMHRSSSRKRYFVLEGESKVLSIQAAAFRRNVQGHREFCCRGLEERLARKGWLSNVRGREVKSRPRADGGMKVCSFTASTLSWLQSRMDMRALVTFALEGGSDCLGQLRDRTFSWCM